MLRREIKRWKYFITFIITTLIFLIGIWAGQLISDRRFNQLEDIQLDLRAKTITLETEYSLLSENPCVLLESDKLSGELYEMGKKLVFMENRYGKNNENVLKLKEYYSLLEVRHWLFLEQVKERCAGNFTTILYFYSNLGDCEVCEQQGYILTYFIDKYPDTKVYSFDINIKNPALEILKDSFNIKEVPTLVINKKGYTGFMKSSELEKHVKK